MTNREKLIQSLQNKVDNENTVENIECPKLRSLDDCPHENDGVHCWQCKSMWLDEESEE